MLPNVDRLPANHSVSDLPDQVAPVYQDCPGVRLFVHGMHRQKWTPQTDLERQIPEGANRKLIKTGSVSLFPMMHRMHTLTEFSGDPTLRLGEIRRQTSKHKQTGSYINAMSC